MSREVLSASSAVASACTAAESIREARQGRGRRQLAKQIGLSSLVLSDIEDASVLPSRQQLIALQQHLGNIRVEGYGPCYAFGEVPWRQAVAEILSRRGPLGDLEIAKEVAASCPECAPAIVSWRLSRELSRLEGSGAFFRSATGKWEMVAIVAPSRNPSHGSTQKTIAHRFSGADDPERDALFHIEASPGVHEVILNTGHPLAPGLQAALQEFDLVNSSREELVAQLVAASSAVRDLLVSWARFEEGEKAGPRRERLREVRQAWGRSAKDVYTSVESSDPTESD